MIRSSVTFAVLWALLLHNCGNPDGREGGDDETTESPDDGDGNGHTGGPRTGRHDDHGDDDDGDDDDGDDDDGDDGAPECANNDSWEPNEIAAKASIVPWDAVSVYDANVNLDAFLCPAENDWYFVEVDSLVFDYYALYVDAIVQGSSWCGMGCGEPWLPNAPENSITVEVYDAQSMQLLTQQSRQNGRIDINAFGEAYSHDLLVHVFSPTPTATWPYALTIEIRGYDGEDECEC